LRNAGPGAKGYRYHDWALIGLAAGRPGHHWLLIRRSRRTGEPGLLPKLGARPVPLATLIQVAGSRWTVEENFQAAGTRQPRKFRGSYVADAGGSVSEEMHAVSRRRI
jgi:hypothetical protein